MNLDAQPNFAPLNRLLGIVAVAFLLSCSKEETHAYGTVDHATAAPATTSAAAKAAPKTEAPPESWPEGTKLTRGGPLPPTPLKRLEDGASFDLGSLRGKAVLLNVWATWCTPCRAETPELATLSKTYAARGLEVVGVSVDDAATESQAIRDFVQEENAEYRMLRQPAGELMEVINTPALPATLLLDRQGGVQWVRVGPLRHDDPRVVSAIESTLK